MGTKKRDTKWRAQECKDACSESKRTRRPYGIYEHVHRFAAWAASRAAGRACFSVACGVFMIEQADLHQYLRNPDKLPKSSRWMDKKHKGWRESIQKAGRRIGLRITDGRAAKLINVYFKAGLVTIANRNNERIGALHPPIDSVLLEQLSRVDQDQGGFWNDMGQRRWTNFTSREYQCVINKIREKLGEERRLWMIEEYWQGYR